MKLRRLATTWPLAWLGLAPLSCNVKVTERCNLRCRMCGIWRRANRSSELPASEWRRIARILHRLHVGRVVITGGEPFVRSDLEAIVSGFSHYDFSLALLTNGVLPGRERLQRVIDCGVHDLGISLDSFDAKVQQSIVGGRDISAKVFQSIETALETVPGLVEVMITVSALNLSEVPAIVKRIHAMGAHAVVNPVNVPASPEQQTVLTSQDPAGLLTGVASSLIDAVYDELVELKRKRCNILNSYKFLEESRRYLKGDGAQWSCDAGRAYFTIFSDGSIAGCSDLPPYRNLARESGFRASRAQRGLLRQQRKSCPGCIYSCWREVSYLLYDPLTIAERIMKAFSLMKQAESKPLA